MKGTLRPKHKGMIYAKLKNDVELPHPIDSTSTSGDDIHTRHKKWLGIYSFRLLHKSFPWGEP